MKYDVEDALGYIEEAESLVIAGFDDQALDLLRSAQAKLRSVLDEM